ncbi:MAG: hypothetical protein ACLUOS_19250 [Odoribacter splanchnicus]
MFVVSLIAYYPGRDYIYLFRFRVLLLRRSSDLFDSVNMKENSLFCHAECCAGWHRLLYCRWIVRDNRLEVFFAVLLLIGVAILAAAFRFRESLPEERRQTGSVLVTFANFRSVLGNKHFVCYMLYSRLMGVLFAYFIPVYFQI